MAKKCSRGIICIDNFTLIFFGLLILVMCLFVFINFNKSANLDNKESCNCSIPGKCKNSNITFLKENNSLPNLNNDILLNPYTAPTRDDRIFNNQSYNGVKIPINQPTQSTAVPLQTLLFPSFAILISRFFPQRTFGLWLIFTFR